MKIYNIKESLLILRYALKLFLILVFVRYFNSCILRNIYASGLRGLIKKR